MAGGGRCQGTSVCALGIPRTSRLYAPSSAAPTAAAPPSDILLELFQMTAPAFLVTIDTEGDNLWSKPRTLTIRNAQYLPPFQALCEKYGLRPTYLTNWEIA